MISRAGERHWKLWHIKDFYTVINTLRASPQAFYTKNDVMLAGERIQTNVLIYGLEMPNMMMDVGNRSKKHILININLF